MSEYERLANGIEVVYAFGHVPDIEHKKVVFLAGTTSWNTSLVQYSWRRYFLKMLAQEQGLKDNIVICVPEPRYGRFSEAPDRHLIEWETEYLDHAHIHVYWLNTYWTYEQAVKNTSQDTRKYFADGTSANIGVTVRSELGASLGRYLYSADDFKLIVGAPADAEGLAWILIQSQITGLPVFRLKDKTQIFDEDWYNVILNELKA